MADDGKAGGTGGRRRVFIAHAGDADVFARELAGRLRSADVAVFIDDGEQAAAEVNAAVGACALFVFVVSAEAVEPGAHTLTELAWAVDRRRELLGVSADGHEHVIPPPEVAAAPRVRGGHSSSVADTITAVRGRLGHSLQPRMRWALALLGCAGAIGAGYHFWQTAGEGEVDVATGHPQTVVDAAAEWISAGAVDAGPQLDVQLDDAGQPVGVWIGDEYAPIVAWAGAPASSDELSIEELDEEALLGGRGAGDGDGVGSQGGDGVGSGDGTARGGAQRRLLPDGGTADGGVGDGGLGDGGVALGPPPPCPVESTQELRGALQLAVNYCLPQSHQATLVASVMQGQLTVGLARASVAGHNIECVRTMMKRAYRGRGEMLLTPVSWRGCTTMSVAVTGYRPSAETPATQ